MKTVLCACICAVLVFHEAICTAQETSVEENGPPSEAAPPDSGRWYIGAGGGITDAYEIFWENAVLILLDFVIPVGYERVVHELDTIDSGFKIFGGYRMSDAVSLEGGYYYLGKYSISDTYVLFGNPTISTTLEEQAHALGLSLLLSPSQGCCIGSWWYVRIGGFYWNTETTITKSDTGESAEGSNTGFDFLAGFGARIDVAKDWRLRLEVEHFSNVNETNRLLYSLSVAIRL